MKCTFNWCTEKRNPAVGIANLRGNHGYPTANVQGQYPLCLWHFKEATEGRWASVTVLGWEPLPDAFVPSVEVKATDVFYD